jgi:hypothetical protein
MILEILESTVSPFFFGYSSQLIPHHKSIGYDIISLLSMLGAYCMC